MHYDVTRITILWAPLSLCGFLSVGKTTLHTQHAKNESFCRTEVCAAVYNKCKYFSYISSIYLNELVPSAKVLNLYYL